MKLCLVFPCFLLGRFPLWVLLVTFYMGKLSLGALLSFAALVILARGGLTAYTSQRSLAFGTFATLWRHIFKPLALLLFIEIAYFGLYYLFTYGAILDFKIALAALASFICYFVLVVFEKKPKSGEVLKRGLLFQCAVFFLWCYFLIDPDGLRAAALILIYALEFVTTFEKELLPAAYYETH